MTLRTGNKRSDVRSGFTLIELVLVMAILVAVLSMSGSSLTSFFKGRALDSEAKRFLALTRYAQNRAVSEGLPTIIWIDVRANKYGMQVSPGFVQRDEKASEFELGRDLTVELLNYRPTVTQGANAALTLRFGPDGLMDESNPEMILIKEKEKTGAAVAITPSRNRLTYEINTNQVYNRQR